MKWTDNAFFYLLMVVHLLGLDMVGQGFFNIQLDLSIFRARILATIVDWTLGIENEEYWL